MELETPPNNGKGSYPNAKPDLTSPSNGETSHTQEPQPFSEDVDSTCSTPYVSAPSSPGRGPVSGFFYSAPASPMHFALASTSLPLAQSSSCCALDNNSVPLSFEFEFSARFGSNGSNATGSMSSADELFLNGKIRPMKLSTHLERPQVLAPLLDLDPEGEEDEGVELAYEAVRGRDLRLRDKSLRRRARSMSPLKTAPFEWTESEKLGGGGGDDDENERFSCKDMKGSRGSEPNKNEEEALSSETTPSVSASSSRSSSAGRNSKRWVFLKDFLYRSKSEGRSNNKFWSTISFSPAKEKKTTRETVPGGLVSKEIKFSNPSNGVSGTQKEKGKGGGGGQSGSSGKKSAAKPRNGVGKRRVPLSPHELHYTANRAQAEELRKKTYLPYRQGLLGCLGFSSKGYGAMNGFARALNPVSSR